MSERIRINGAEEPLAGATVAALLAARGVTGKRGMAVAVNGAVVPARLWADTILAPGDEIEIVRPFGGG
jgi:sulfur carrier protein